MAMFNNPIDTLTRQRLNKAPFIGYVVDNVDPDTEKPKQRARIRVPQLHRNIPDEKLPLALPTSQKNNAGAGVGSVDVPPNGSKVYYHFDEDDPHNPKYGGSPTTDDVNAENELLQEDAPHTRGRIDQAGNRWAVNSEQNTVDFTHSSGTTIHIDANGSVSVSCQDYNVGAEGNINMVAKGGVFLNGQEVHFNKKGRSAGSRSQRSRPNIPDQSGQTSL